MRLKACSDRGDGETLKQAGRSRPSPPQTDQVLDRQCNHFSPQAHRPIVFHPTVTSTRTTSSRLQSPGAAAKMQSLQARSACSSSRPSCSTHSGRRARRCRTWATAQPAVKVRRAGKHPQHAKQRQRRAARRTMRGCTTAAKTISCSALPCRVLFAWVACLSRMQRPSDAAAPGPL
jgi:hypothetical protein